MLSRLVYFSRPVALGDAEIDAIARACYVNNSASHVTGVLFYNGQWFIQVLEGAQSTLTAMFATIATDPRHREVNLIEFAFVPRRLFADWSIQYLGSSAEQEAIIRRHMPAEFDPRAITESAAAAPLLCDLADVVRPEVS